MSKKSDRLLTVGLCLALLLGTLAGCTGADSVAPVENSYVTNYSLSSHEGASDITIDGVLDEAAWQNKGWFQNTYRDNERNNLPVMRLTAFPTEQGVYIASVVKDTCLSNDGERDPNRNSSWELYLAACDVGDSLYSAENKGSWNMRRIYVDMRGDSFSVYTNTDRAVVVDGVLNSNETTGATLEMFVSWESLEVDVSKGIPETVGILPCYRATLVYGATTTWMSPLDGNTGNTMSCFIFDKNGYVSADAENCTVGDAYNGYAKSRGWDVSQEREGIVRSNQGEWCRMFFSDAYAENMIVEATLIPVAAINDAWPKAGMYFLKSDGTFYSVWLDAQGADGLVDSINGTKNFPGYHLVTFDQTVTSWHQVSLTGYDTENPNATTQEGVKLTVVKYGDNFWYFADGKFLTNEQVEWMSGSCMPGFFTLGFEVIYKDYSWKEITADDLASYLNGSDLYVVNAEVDGSGGEVAADKASIRNGDSYTLSFITKSGYRLSSVMINGTEMIDDVRANAENGVYTVANAQGNQEILVDFEKVDGVTYSGIVTDGTENIVASIVIFGVDDGSAYYVGESTARKGFEFKLPAGIYEICVQAENGQWQTKTVEIAADTEDEILYQGWEEIP